MSLIVVLPGLLLLLFALLPGVTVSRHRRFLARTVTGLAAVNLAAAIAGFLSVVTDGARVGQLTPAMLDDTVSFSVWLNGSSALMLLLVAFITWVVSRYSERYLDGETASGRYFQWLAVTAGAISLTVTSGNLIMLLAFLLTTSFGMSRLLTHYEDRPAARSAAALKFWLSRVGDVFLVLAAVALYRATGTLELAALADAVGRVSEAGPSAALQTSAWMLILCAFCKSAQFPFHTWLPDTMEAPTPVSALMHAGVVNAGGYLLIRTAPVVVQAPAAMSLAIVVGASTALIAALVMLSQSSVKRSLAWSTVAQMGFMILQCGLGAFSAAMLHLIAHSLYKAWAFLASGDVLNQPAKSPSVSDSSAFPLLVRFGVAALIIPLTFVGISQLAGFSLAEKPGGFLLGTVLCLGLVRSVAGVSFRSWAFAGSVAGGLALLITLYFASFGFIDTLVGNAGVSVPGTMTTGLLMAVAAVLWGLMLLLEALIPRCSDSPWMQRLYVHSCNGFYVDVFWKNLSRTLTS